MMKKTLITIGCLGAAILLGQQSFDVVGTIMKSDPPAIAVADFRGSGEAQQFMGAFNQTLFGDLQNSGQLNMVPKSRYPLQVPQQPSDFKPAGPKLSDWANPPVSANYLAFGYTSIQNGKLVLFGWLFSTAQPDVQSAQLIGKLYFGNPDEAGANNVAHQFAADILQQFGAKSLAGSKIYFVSDRTGNKEIWQMDFDGSNQKQITSYHSISTMPAVSPDGTKIAFTSYLKSTPAIVMHSLETGRRIPFYNQTASMNATPEFSQDGKQLLFSSTLAGGYAQIYSTDVSGGSLRRISQVRAIEVEPKVNPKTGAEIVFVSGRGGLPQIYKMNADGADLVRLTNGEGEAVNPAWHPDGKLIAFAWTKGFDPGNYNIFIMDVASGKLVQLTHGDGRNENPSWAPDGIHIVYSSKRGRSTQLYSMLANGEQKQQLTTQGSNFQPVWSKAQN